MKPILIYLIVLLTSLNLFAQNDSENFLLFPHNGNPCIYEFKTSEYLLNNDGVKLNEFVASKLVEIDLINIATENKEMLRVEVLENKAYKPGETPLQIRDYKFPQFKDGFYKYKNDNYFEYLLCSVDFIYDFDFETSKVTLYNREEVLLDIRKILEEKGYDKIGIDNQTNDFNTKAIPLITKLVQSLYQVEGNNFLNPAEYDSGIEVNKNSITTIRNKRYDKKPGLYQRNIKINQAEHYLIECHTIEIDTFKNRFYAFGDYYNRVYVESKTQLKEWVIKESNRFIISGKFENPKQRKVSLVFLRNPFGPEVYQETVFLVENNTFQIETELNHPGLVFLFLGQTNSTVQVPVVPVYAEPGSRTNLKIYGDSIPLNVGFSGDNDLASEMAYNFLKEYDLLEESIYFNSLYWRLYQTKYKDLVNAFSNLTTFTDNYKNKIPEKVFSFVLNELKAKLYVGIFYYLDRFEESQNQFFYRPTNNIGKPEGEFLKSIADTFQLASVYNPNGVYSRQLANDYFRYQFRSVRKVIDPHSPRFSKAIVISNFRFYEDLPHKIEMAKAMLSGHALYSEIATMLTYDKSRVYRQESKDDIYRQNVVDNYLDLLIRLCNDKEFTDAIKSLVKNQSQWNSKEFVPETKFFNPKGEPAFFKDFLGKKPSVFYITEEWSRERYYFDDLAKENPEINFVMVAEGSNFQEWMDYTKRAEPLANQLFLVNNKQQLKDIFKQSGHHFIVYDASGSRIGFVGNMLSATNIAKKSMETPKKKELDKSQLQIIVIVLIAILTVLIVGLIMWKWRVRQRFRREQQFRRLKELELTAIRSQMNPHFLFNALNSVQNLVQQNKGREAHLYLADFAGLIRKVLQNSEKEEVSLAEELEMTEQYLNLEKLRFHFEFSISLEKTIDANNTMVPGMLLQPFAENAVIHGLQAKEGNRNLKIEVKKGGGEEKIEGRGEGLVIWIEDNGIGREAAREITKAKNGKGSKLIAERLAILQEKQGEKYSLEIIDLKEGTRVEIVIPEEK